MAIGSLIRLPVELIPYAQGDVDQEPPRGKHSFNDIKTMRRYRTAYLRNLLQSGGHDTAVAWEKPDFWKHLGPEIIHYCKRELWPYIRKNWDDVVSECPKFYGHFRHEHLSLVREYDTAILNNKRPRKKQNSLLAEARRYALRKILRDQKLIGELELACFGITRYGVA